MKILITAFLVTISANAALGQNQIPGLVSADSLWTLGERAAALTALETVANRAHQEDATETEIRALTLLGARRIAVGHPVEAENPLRTAADLAAGMGDTLSLMPAIRWLSLSVSQRGQVALADSLYQQLYDLATACGDERHQGWASVGFASRFLEKGQPREASLWYMKAATHLQLAGEIGGELWARNGLGIALNRQRRYAEALAVYQQVARRARTEGALHSLANATNNIGNLQLLLGDPAAGQQAFGVAMELADSLGMVESRLTSALNLALSDVELGELDTAAAILDSNLAFCQERNLAEKKGQFLLEKGRLEMTRERPETARRYREMALAMGDTLPVRDRAQVVADLAGSALHDGAPDQALALLDQWQDRLPRDGLGAVSWEQDLLRARALLDLGQVQRSMALLSSLDVELRGLGAHRLAMDEKLLMARALVESGRPDEASEALQEAMTAWEHHREKPGEFRWREARAAAGREAFLQWAWLHQHHPELQGQSPDAALFQTLQRYKARTFLERLAGPAFADSLAPSIPSLATLADLRRILGPRDLALDWYLGPERSLLLAITRSQLRAIWLPPESILADRVDLYLELLTGDSLSLQEKEKSLAVASRSLADMLLGQARDLVTPADQIISCADGSLHGLPFEVLCCFAGCDSLDVRQPWRLTPTLSLLTCPGTQDSETDNGMLALGSRELEGTRRELEQLSRRYSNTETVSTCADCPPLSAKMLAQRSIVHVASHVQIDNLHPWQSALDLPFTGDGDTVGPLTAADLLSLSLDNDLTVLNGCATAGGRVLAGEGPLGLATSFLVGGSRCVVATLWPISDLAAEKFSASFYRKLEQHGTVGEALAFARSTLKASAETADPVHWGAYVIFGDPGVTVNLHRRRPMPPSFLIGGTLAGIILLGLAGRVVFRKPGRQT